MNDAIDKQFKLIATYARVSKNQDEQEQTIKNQSMVFRYNGKFVRLLR